MNGYPIVFTNTDRIIIPATAHKIPNLTPALRIKLFAQKDDGTADFNIPLDHELTQVEVTGEHTVIITLLTPRSGVAYVLPPPTRPYIEPHIPHPFGTS